MNPKVSKREALAIDKLVAHYISNKSLFDRLALNLATLFTENNETSKLIHSVKWRVKDPVHLKDKLERKLLECKERNITFDITSTNLFEKINDLAGVRILHLHTTQIGEIDGKLKELLDHELYNIVQGPFARTWDDEYRTYFQNIGISTEESKSLYTSVHYVVQPNHRTKYTAEIQVRTLAEELWGEVAHSINYPHPTASLACREQIMVLARITSSCTRLVDSLYKSRAEYQEIAGKDILKK